MPLQVPCARVQVTWLAFRIFAKLWTPFRSPSWTNASGGVTEALGSPLREVLPHPLAMLLVFMALFVVLGKFSLRPIQTRFEPKPKQFKQFGFENSKKKPNRSVCSLGPPNWYQTIPNRLGKFIKNYLNLLNNHSINGFKLEVWTEFEPKQTVKFIIIRKYSCFWSINWFELGLNLVWTKPNWLRSNLKCLFLIGLKRFGMVWSGLNWFGPVWFRFGKN